jgi:hypothetical protein
MSNDESNKDGARNSKEELVVGYRGPVEDPPRMRPWGQAVALYVAVFFAVGLGMILAIGLLGLLLKVLSWLVQ